MAFAYLFERFPTFTQTFCVREVAAVRAIAPGTPVFSVRRPSGEPAQDFPPEGIRDVTYLPSDIEAALRDEPAPLREKIRRRWELWRRANEPDRKRFFEALWLGPILQERGVTHVHVHFAGLAARTAWWLRRLHGISYSFTAHANDFFVGANEKSPIRLGDLFTDAVLVTTVSDFSRRLLAERFPDEAGKIERVYNGVDCARYSGGVKSTPPLIVGVGRYIEKKGFADLVEACALLGDVPLRCEIIGGGPLADELQAQVARLGQQERVVIAGPMSENAIIERLAAADVFALPCVRDSKGDSDNLPTVIMEAMAARLPVVSTPVAGVPEMVEDGVNGFLVPQRDPAALATRLRELLADAALRTRLGEAGHGLCTKKFSVEKTSRQLHDLLARF